MCSEAPKRRLTADSGMFFYDNFPSMTRRAVGEDKRLCLPLSYAAQTA